jgi:hypothetical protein
MHSSLVTSRQISAGWRRTPSKRPGPARFSIQDLPSLLPIQREERNDAVVQQQAAYEELLAKAVRSPVGLPRSRSGASMPCACMRP